jgi:putative NADPH-quinone reductase
VSARILVLQGHPDRRGGHLCHALAAAYRDGAESAGHIVRELTIAGLGVPLLSTREEWESDCMPESVRAAQEAIAWAEHLVVLYPLWLGDMPAVLKGFFEQVLRPGFAIGKAESGGFGTKLLKGKTARVVVTMGMPGFLYRWYFGAHSLRSMLGICGVGPIRSNLFGLVEAGRPARQQRWLGKMRRLGTGAR